jgi:hypothetical protein
VLILLRKLGIGADGGHRLQWRNRLYLLDNLRTALGLLYWCFVVRSNAALSPALTNSNIITRSL